MESGLAGRDKELESALGIYGHALVGQGSFLLISGNAGIGKTRYVEELKRITAKTGCRIMTGHCHLGATAPFLPFIEAFSADFDDVSFNPKSEVGENAQFSSPQEVLFPTLRILSKIASKNPLLIHIEDIQWADSPTIDLLHFLARSIGNLRIVIVATYRSEELESGSTIDNPYFFDTIRRMGREGLIHEIALKSLRPNDLKKIAHAMIEGELEPKTLRKLTDFVDGNPLFFIEIIRYLSTNKLFKKENGHLELKKGHKIESPPSLQELVLKRYDPLSIDQKTILNYASVAGEWFDLELLTKAFEIDKGELRKTLNILSIENHFFEITDDRYHFGNQVIQQAIYQNIPSEIRKEIHLKLGQIIEKMEIKDPLYSSLSDHFYLAGDQEKAVEYSVRAGEIFLEALAFNDAIVYLTRAESLLETLGFSGIRINLFEYLGDAYRELDNDKKADEYYQKCLPLVIPSSGDQGRLLWKRAACWYPIKLGMGYRVEFIKLIEDAESCSGLLPRDLAEIEVLRGLLDFLDKKHENAKAHYAKAKKIFDQEKALDKYVEISLAEIEIALSEGDLGRSKIKLEGIQNIISKDTGKMLEMGLRFTQGTFLWHMGELEKALSSYDSSLDIATKICNYHFMALTNQYLSLIHIERGDLYLAEICIRNSLDQLELVEIQIFHSRVLAILAHLHLLNNELNEAKPLLAESIEEMEGFSSPLNITSGIVKLVEAEMMFSLGHKEVSESEFNLAIDLLEKSVYGLLFKAMGFTWYAELLRRNGDSHKADELIKIAKTIYDDLRRTASQSSL